MEQGTPPTRPTVQRKDLAHCRLLVASVWQPGACSPAGLPERDEGTSHPTLSSLGAHGNRRMPPPPPPPCAETGMARVGKGQAGLKYTSQVSEHCRCHPKVVVGAEEPQGRSLQKELCSTAPSYKRSPQPPGARGSRPISSPATTLHNSGPSSQDWLRNQLQHRQTQHFPLPWLLWPKMLGVWAWSPAEVYSRTGAEDSPRPSCQQSRLWQRWAGEAQESITISPSRLLPSSYPLSTVFFFKNGGVFTDLISLLIYRPQKASGFLCKDTNWVALWLEGSKPLMKGPPMLHISSNRTITNHPCEKVSGSSLLLPAETPKRRKLLYTA